MAFRRKTGLKSLLHHNLLEIIIKMNVEAECHPGTLQNHTSNDKVQPGITARLAAHGTVVKGLAVFSSPYYRDGVCVCVS